MALASSLTIFLNMMPAGNAVKIGAQVAKLLLNTAKHKNSLCISHARILS